MVGDTGYCAKCDRPGPVAEVCPGERCAATRHHFIPEPYYRAICSKNAFVRDRDLGRTIDEYLLVDVLGRGTYGKVYLALQRPLLVKTALKLLTYESHDDEIQRQVREKFEGEARSLARLDHPNIVKMVRYGRIEDAPFIVMEYVDNARRLKEALDDRVALGGGFSFDIVRHVATQLLNALQCAHEAGIVHRDLKPENIMLQEVSGDGYFVRVLDFGLAKFVGAGQTRSTAMIAGTPAYMAPEQVARRNIGPWSDIYAVGLIILEMLVGVRVFQWWDPQAVFSLKGDARFRPVENFLGLDLPPPMFAFLKKATAFDVAERFSDAADCRRGLDEAFSTLRSHLRRSIRLIDLERRLSPSALTEVTRLREQDLQALGSHPSQRASAAATAGAGAPTVASEPGKGSDETAPAATIFVDHAALALSRGDTAQPTIRAVAPETPTVLPTPVAEDLISRGPGPWIWGATLTFVALLLGSSLYLWFGSTTRHVKQAPPPPVAMPGDATLSNGSPPPLRPKTTPKQPPRIQTRPSAPHPAPQVVKRKPDPPDAPDSTTPSIVHLPNLPDLELSPRKPRRPVLPRSLVIPQVSKAAPVCKQGVALAHQGRLQQAEEYLVRCLRSEPKLAIAHLYLSTIASARGDRLAACRHLRRFVDLSKVSAVLKAMREQLRRMRCP